MSLLHDFDEDLLFQQIEDYKYEISLILHGNLGAELISDEEIEEAISNGYTVEDIIHKYIKFKSLD